MTSKGVAVKKTGIGRKSGLRASRFQKVTQRSAAEQELRVKLALAFHDAGVRKGYCSVCHMRSPFLHAHHCIEASFLRRELRSLGVPQHRIDAISFDGRNALGLCDHHHAAHHGPSVKSPVTRKHIPESAWEFAKELDGMSGDERFTVRLEMYREAA